MINRIAVFICLFFSTVLSLHAQVPFTAQDPQGAPVYTGGFYYGTNMGWYGNTWNDEAIADIAAGNVQKNVAGVGAKTLRPSLYEAFMETWGYDIRLHAFAHYAALGIRDNTVFLGLPALPAHRDGQFYQGCNQPSQLFKNMYEPIWDGGLNGTPVNEQNYFAAYVYQTVTRYKNYVKFWEIINEPDLDGGSTGWKPRGMAGNWWENNPSPCDLVNMYAPVQHYIRLLRIGYEVIKSVDPTAYVTTGGIGYPSFLDAILRNTDNPVDGSVTAQYPHRGGAWFDGLSFHSYPMYSLRYWDAQQGAMAYRRHSDAALDGYLSVHREMDSVLNLYQYNGNTYPKKTFICTENNIARGAFGDLVGGDEVQKNYLIKALVGSQRVGIRQYYVYGIAESKSTNEAWDPFQLMGLYQKLEGIGPLGNGGQYLQQYTPEGIGFKTSSDLLMGAVYDEAETQRMQLPNGLRGAAFLGSNSAYTYVLWAVTGTDLSEQASATYSFPPALSQGQSVKRRDWDFSQTQQVQSIPAQNIPLTASPVFLQFNQSILVLPNPGGSPNTNPFPLVDFQVYPQPAQTQISLKWTQQQVGKVSWEIYNLQGQRVHRSTDEVLYRKGLQQVSVGGLERLPGGTYIVRLKSGLQQLSKPLMVLR